MQGTNVFHERILEKYLVMKKYMRNFAAEMGRTPHTPALSIVMEKEPGDKRQIRFKFASNPFQSRSKAVPNNEDVEPKGKFVR